MEPITRRSTLRLVGSAAGVTGLAGAAVLGGESLFAIAEASSGRKIKATLNKTSFRPGEVMRLHVTELLKPGAKLRVSDTHGARWRRISRDGNRQVWIATAKRSGTAAVAVHALWPNGRVVHNKRYHDRVRYHVNGSFHLGGALIGMSAPSEQWDDRVREVGPGLAARRIFADLAAGPTSQLKIVEEAHQAGMLPVISYKVGGDVSGAVNGRYNAVAAQAAERLASFKRPTAVAFWHEPNPDMTGAQYAAASRQILPHFKRGKLKVGPILNGWLLDNRVDEFASYCAEDLFDLWDWFGIDTYESGSMNNPGDNKPADRIPKLRKFLRSRGHKHLPLGVGEYNGYSGATITAAGEALMSTPNVWFGCLWNSSGGKGIPLSGERLAAFKRTLADPRSADPRVSADERRTS